MLFRSPKLLVHFFRLRQDQQGQFPEKIAIVVDSRGGRMFSDLFRGLDQLKQMGYSYQILYLDARDDVIVTRYKETRRKHPLLDEEHPSMQAALERERELLRPARDQADYVIDTSLLGAGQLKEQIAALFFKEKKEKMLITCTSFGFKYGIPFDADLVLTCVVCPTRFTSRS